MGASESWGRDWFGGRLPEQESHHIELRASSKKRISRRHDRQGKLQVPVDLIFSFLPFDYHYVNLLPNLYFHWISRLFRNSYICRISFQQDDSFKFKKAENQRVGIRESLSQHEGESVLKVTDLVVVIHEGQLALRHEQFPLELVPANLLVQILNPLLLLWLLYFIKSLYQQLAYILA